MQCMNDMIVLCRMVYIDLHFIICFCKWCDADLHFLFGRCFVDASLLYKFDLTVGFFCGVVWAGVDWGEIILQVLVYCYAWLLVVLQVGTGKLAFYIVSTNTNRTCQNDIIMILLYNPAYQDQKISLIPHYPPYPQEIPVLSHLQIWDKCKTSTNTTILAVFLSLNRGIFYILILNAIIPRRWMRSTHRFRPIFTPPKPQPTPPPLKIAQNPHTIQQTTSAPTSTHPQNIP